MSYFLENGSKPAEALSLNLYSASRCHKENHSTWCVEMIPYLKKKSTLVISLSVPSIEILLADPGEESWVLSSRILLK